MAGRTERRYQFFCRTAALLGSRDAEQLLASLNRPVPRAVRYHRRQCSPAELKGEVVPWNEPFGRYWQQQVLPSRTLEYAAGRYYIQEASAMLAIAAASRVIDFSGMIALDLCAAPGGKATQAAELISSGYLVANEVVKKRVPALIWNINRHRLDNVVVTSVPTALLARSLAHFFDVVIVDAPCSGEGLFQRGKHSPDKWSEKSVLSCARRQRAILQDAAALVRPGGYLVYSTCTFAREENEDQVEFLFDRGFDPLPLPNNLPVSQAVTGNERVQACSRRIFPHQQKGAGAFVSTLQKGARDAHKPQIKYETGKHRHTALKSVPWFTDTSLPGFFYEKKGVVSYFSYDHIPCFLHQQGLQIGAPLIDKHRGSEIMFGCTQAASTEAIVEVSSQQAEAYVQGQELGLKGADGWYFVAYQGMVLGPVKITNGQVINKFPPPLRKPKPTLGSCSLL